MNELKDTLDSTLKNMTFSKSMKNRVIEECSHLKDTKQKNKLSFEKILVPVTLFVIFCISITVAVKGLKSNSNDSTGEKVSLEKNVEYSQYDVTGDGRTDKVEIQQKKHKDNNESITLKVLINDQLAFQEKELYEPYWYVDLIKLANGKVFFSIGARENDYILTLKLYAYKDDKLECVHDFYENYNNYASSYIVNIHNVFGNTIETEVSAQFHVTGGVQYDMDLEYKDGSFKNTSSEFPIKYKEMSKKNKWTVNRTIKIYKEAGSKDTAYTLKKGNVVKIDKVIYKNDEVYFQVVNSKGKTGYMEGVKEYQDISFFKEVMFAG